MGRFTVVLVLWMVSALILIGILNFADLTVKSGIFAAAVFTVITVLTLIWILTNPIRTVLKNSIKGDEF